MSPFTIKSIFVSIRRHFNGTIHYIGQLQFLICPRVSVSKHKRRLGSVGMRVGSEKSFLVRMMEYKKANIIPHRCLPGQVLDQASHFQDNLNYDILHMFH